MAKVFQHDFVKVPPLQQVTNTAGIRNYVTDAGDAFESVTTFIGRHWDKTFLDAWRKRIGEVAANNESVRAQKRGTEIHKMVETYLLNETQKFDNPFSKQLFMKMRPSLDKIDNIKLIESPIYSLKLKLAGTPDVISNWGNLGLSVIDFKTSKRKKKKAWTTHYFLQAAAYGYMYNEMFGVTPKTAVIVMVVEDERDAVIYTEDMGNCIKALFKFIDDPVGFQKRLKAA